LFVVLFVFFLFLCWVVVVCFGVLFLFFLPVGQLFRCRVFLRVRGPTERRLALPVKEFYCSSCFVYCLSCGLFVATVCMADLESTRRTAFWNAIGLKSSCCSAVAIAVISPSKLA
jgi:hypothetical protein